MIKRVKNPAFELTTERELVARVQQGDADAFRLLYLSYKAYVATQCRRLGCQSEVTEDLTQDVFIHLWVKIGQFKGHSTFRTWLYRVTENVVFSYFRKNKRRICSRVTPGSSSEDFDLDNWTAVPSTQEDRIWISEILSSLKPPDQLVLRLFTAGYKHEEIAQLLGLTPATCKSRLCRVRLKIQKNLRLFRQKAVLQAS